MNPMIMQMWLAAFEASLRANDDDAGGAAGYRAAKYADEVIAGAQRSAAEAKAAAGKVVTL